MQSSVLAQRSRVPLDDNVLLNSSSFGLASSLSYSPQSMALSKEGWLEKYSVGRGALPMKNWRKRYFVANVSGLDYFDNPPRSQTNNLKGKPLDGDSRKGKSKTEKRKIYFSVANSPALSHTGSQRQLPVFLLPHIDESFHPAAVNAGPANPFAQNMSVNNNIYYYFALRFSENKQTLLLLCRTRDPLIRREWTDFLSLFIHSLGSNPAAAGSMLSSHPILVQVAAADNFEQQRVAYQKTEEQKNSISGDKKKPSRFDGYKKNRKELEMSHINGNDLDSNLNDNQQIVLKWDEGLHMRFVEHHGYRNASQATTSPNRLASPTSAPSNAPSNSPNSSNIALGASSISASNSQWNNFFGPSALFSDDNTNSIAPALTRQVSSALGDAVYWTDDDHGSEFDDI